MFLYDMAVLANPLSLSDKVGIFHPSREQLGKCELLCLALGNAVTTTVTGTSSQDLWISLQCTGSTEISQNNQRFS